MDGTSYQTLVSANVTIDQLEQEIEEILDHRPPDLVIKKDHPQS